jgi:hypothetical protein
MAVNPEDTGLLGILERQRAVEGQQGYHNVPGYLQRRFSCHALFG